MGNDDLTGFTGRASPAPEPAAFTVPPALAFDAARYRPLLGEDEDFTGEQVREILAILFDIMRRFVELGFSVQSCGKLPEPASKLSERGCGDVDCKDHGNMNTRKG